jgi:hypothetical protein
MKKLISLALISTVLALPAAASAAGQLPGPFKNKGQCQSAYNAFLVDARKDAHQTDGISPSDVNAFVHDHVSCQQNANGEWELTFTP